VIYEQTRVTEIQPGRISTDRGRVRADVVVRATEAYTARLPGLRRAIAPLYSLMIVTEPLPAGVWDLIGWNDRETFSDARHMIIYAQRTEDGRIAFGGRGAPYHFASRISDRFDRNGRVHHDLLPNTMRLLFPMLRDVAITHEWGGPLGAARDWTCSVGFDRASGLAWAGGYVGDGVATSELAGSTLADLILGRDTDLTTLPWVGHESPRWEPEPLRWLGINTAVRLTDGADRAEQRHGKPSRWRMSVIDRVVDR
jgi:glycine/D-amino acid oxidase-like deaminating enzyme